MPDKLGEMSLIELDLSENDLSKSLFSKNWRWMNGKVLRSTLQALNLSDNNVK